MLGARGKQVCAGLAGCGSAWRRSRGALGSPTQRRGRHALPTRVLTGTLVRVLRWVAVPLAVVAGYYLAFLLFLKIELSCLPRGVLPGPPCSEWWSENHSWVGAVVFGLALSIGPILLPMVLAPRFKGVVGTLAFAMVAFHTISEFDTWAWSVAMPVAAASAALWSISFRRRLFPAVPAG